MPNKVDPNFVAKAKYSEAEWTRKSGYVDSGKAAFMPSKAPSRHTVFQEFEYIPSLYTLADELRSEERKASTVAQQEIGKMPFVCSDTAMRLKHEEGYASFTRPSDRTEQMNQGSTCACLASFPAGSDPSAAARALGDVWPLRSRIPDAPGTRQKARYCMSHACSAHAARAQELQDLPPDRPFAHFPQLSVPK